MNSICEGCRGGNTSNLICNNMKDHKCICSSCLIKGMCEDICLDKLNLVIHIYETHLYPDDVSVDRLKEYRDRKFENETQI